MTRVAVLGAGSWGTTFAAVIADAGTDVVLWARREEVAREIRTAHTNRAYLGDLELNPRITATADPAEALAGAEVVVLAVPAQSLRANLGAWMPLIADDATPGPATAAIAVGIATKKDPFPHPFNTANRISGPTELLTGQIASMLIALMAVVRTRVLRGPNLSHAKPERSRPMGLWCW